MIVLVFLLFTFCGISQNRIKIDSIDTSPVEVTSLLFGSFFEFLDDFINGYAGIWAQELINRGFDMPDITEATALPIIGSDFEHQILQMTNLAYYRKGITKTEFIFNELQKSPL